MNPGTKIGIVCALTLGGIVAWRWAGKTEVDTRQRLPPDFEPRFSLKEVASEWGLDFVNDPGHPTFFYPEIIGSGVATADFDNDGRLDVLLRGASPGRGHPHGKSSPTSRLFLQTVEGRFSDASVKSGITDDGYAMGAAVGDVNNDGIPDLYLCNFGIDRLYMGKGGGTFIDATKSSGLYAESFGSSACFVDFDRDGRLDLYVADYISYRVLKRCKHSQGQTDYCHPREFPGLPHRLYRNVTPPGAPLEGVKFQDVSVQAGIASKHGRGMGVMLIDANDDHWPDLYVANDSEPNFLWINQKDGTFIDNAALDGVAVNGAGQPQGSMGVAEADFDGDGRLDLAVTNFRAECTTVYARRAYGFQDRSGVLGVAALTRPFTGFGLAAIDIDADGAEEIIQANGRVSRLDTDGETQPPTDLSARDAVCAFWNAYAERSQILCREDGRFKDAGSEAGDFGRLETVGRGLAVGDMNRDGRPDLLALDLNAKAKLFLNRSKLRGKWISVRAVDPQKSGRDALGALIVVVSTGDRIPKRIRTCGSYQSASEPRAFFGLGSRSSVESVEIVWPDGDATAETFSAPELDRSYTFHRGKGTRTK